MTLSTVIVRPSRSGVRASPAARMAADIMKNSSMPMLPMKLMRRNGSACSLTSGAAWTRSSRRGVGEISDRRHHDEHPDRGQKGLLHDLD